jgi:folate-binding protein YgfZ
MIADMHVLQSETMMLLDVPADLLDSLLQRLDQFLFTENVQLQSLAGALTSVWVHGPESALVVGRVLDVGELDTWAAYRHARVSMRSEPDTAVVVARIDQLGVPGFALYVDPARREALEAALVEGGAAHVSADAIEAARIASGYPVFGIDMTSDTIPLEAGIEGRAISFTKGCYVGQEVIIRVLHRGGGRVARKLVTLRIDGPVPQRGAKLYAAEREIGAITSAAESPRLGTIRVRIRPPRLRCSRNGGVGRYQRRSSSCERRGASAVVSSVISSSSAGGNPRDDSSPRATHRISWPRSGRGAPRNVQR